MSRYLLLCHAQYAIGTGTFEAHRNPPQQLGSAMLIRNAGAVCDNATQAFDLLERGGTLPLPFHYLAAKAISGSSTWRFL
jgi:hypothetical protein